MDLTQWSMVWTPRRQNQPENIIDIAVVTGMDIRSGSD